MRDITRRAYDELLWALLRKNMEYFNRQTYNVSITGNVKQMAENTLTYEVAIEPGKNSGRWTQEGFARHILDGIVLDFETIDKGTHPSVSDDVWRQEHTEDEKLLFGDEDFTPNLRANITISIGE